MFGGSSTSCHTGTRGCELVKMRDKMKPAIKKHGAPVAEFRAADSTGHRNTFAESLSGPALRRLQKPR
jgi:hypothetical protein